MAAGDDRRIHHGINLARDAIFVANSRNQGAGILDNDYMAAFDFMVLTWVFRVLKAKGLAEEVINKLKSMYENHLTVVVINNIHGKCFTNIRWSIRQGDRPSSNFFCYGLDPHLDWLENRLTGILVYKNPLNCTPPEIYKLKAYVDDVKPGITTMNEFSIVDRGSSLFEAASGCKLHRDPSSGKVKFLPLGRWKGTLTREDLPVPYIVLSEHLDMVGVKLMASYQKTRKVNCDELQSKVQNITGCWRGGKFMTLTDRPHSLNNFCLSKVWFRCSSINLRVSDFNKINSNIKSWLYADQLEKPEDHVLARPRRQGGLGVIHVQCKALSLLIRSFLETALIPTFQHNQFHKALYMWHVEDRRDIACPSQPPYYDNNFFASIRQVKDEGLLNLKTMSSGMWYKVLVENSVTHQQTQTSRELLPCRAEIKHPGLDWEKSWSLAVTPGLPSPLLTFLWRMLHDLLPTQARLFRLKMPNANSNQCSLCDLNAVGDLTHSLLVCPYNGGAGQFLISKLLQVLPSVLPHQVVLLDFDVDKTNQLPILFLTASILSQVWECRKDKKSCKLSTIRAVLEAGVCITRKSRHSEAAKKLSSILETI